MAKHKRLKVACYCHGEPHEVDASEVAKALAKRNKYKRVHGSDGRFKKKNNP